MKRILNQAIVYNFYQNLIGSRRYLRLYSENFIQAKDGQKILDIACGTGNIIEFLPKNIDYTGVDYSLKYIEFCKKKFPQFSFICANSFEDMGLDMKYDIIICEALISNGSDYQVMKLFESIKRFSTKSTKILISEMNYTLETPFVEKKLYLSERGSYLRYRDEYINLISEYFNIKKYTIVEKPYYIPYQKIVFECELK